MKIKKNIRVSISVLSLLTLLYSCNKAKYYKITQDEEDSWAIFTVNQSFKFISTQGNLRTYDIGGKFKAYNRDGNVYNEYLYTTVYLQGDTGYDFSKGYRGLFMDKTADGLSIKVGLPHFYENVKINDQAPTQQTINGKNYADVYVVAANPLYLDSVNDIDTIYYSQTFGYLKYVDIYGETYVKTQ